MIKNVITINVLDRIEEIFSHVISVTKNVMILYLLHKGNNIYLLLNEGDLYKLIFTTSKAMRKKVYGNIYLPILF